MLKLIAMAKVMSSPKNNLWKKNLFQTFQRNCYEKIIKNNKKKNLPF